jgi:chemotaxis protein histidine kinase CheA
MEKRRPKAIRRRMQKKRLDEIGRLRVEGGGGSGGAQEQGVSNAQPQRINLETFYSNPHTKSSLRQPPGLHRATATARSELPKFWIGNQEKKEEVLSAEEETIKKQQELLTADMERLWKSVEKAQKAYQKKVGKPAQMPNMRRTSTLKSQRRLRLTRRLARQLMHLRMRPWAATLSR